MKAPGVTRFIAEPQSLSWLLLLSLPAFLAAQSVPPSASELITRAIAAQKAQDDRGWKYTFREDHTDWQLDKNGNRGQSSVKTYDHIMLEGSEYSKLILIDGKPLDAKTQKQVDEDLEKARAERKKNHLFNRSVSLGTLELLNRLFDNRVAGEEIVMGRKTWRVESEPKAGIKTASKAEEEAMSSRHTNWFDQEEGMGIREVSEFIRATNGFQPGSRIDTALMKVGDDWLPGDYIMHADVKLVVGIRARVESQQHFYDHRRFTVDSSFNPQ